MFEALKRVSVFFFRSERITESMVPATPPPLLNENKQKPLLPGGRGELRNSPTKIKLF